MGGRTGALAAGAGTASSTTLVVNRWPGPSNDSAAAAVNSFVVEAGMNAVVATRS